MRMMSGTAVRQGQKLPIVSNRELIDNFNQRFAVITADTIALQEQAYRLRYQVYCIENNFENPLDHQLEQEMDEFDARSVHSVIIDRPSQDVIGTVRIILPDPDAIEKSFPIQRECSLPLMRGNKKLNTSRSAEISRFAVSKEFSRRTADHQPSPRQAADLRDERRSAMPNITLGLMNGIVRMSVEHGITEWFAVMEPTLLRLLARFGIYFSPIGPMVNYHGMRQPCHANVESLLGRVRKERIDVWEVITDNGTLLDRENQPFASFRLIN
jgi:N-acyl amino acid synthase of PEP-CTERM/exosortase system